MTGSGAGGAPPPDVEVGEVRLERRFRVSDTGVAVAGFMAGLGTEDVGMAAKLGVGTLAGAAGSTTFGLCLLPPLLGEAAALPAFAALAADLDPALDDPVP
eukprot:CAMPEP_0202920448 /NCGR_PEP_ID=MMETSP1392-20130828/76864_1 /ASSEMBLY_ACC=CAM_ASM_000868 /TAXON_ID=225041 /ORGANISM="Chlamydomonas chlamydogama, Strain SAG 11-48b" /LENGTH=100 /DNA_ID=CAMNT_0049613945 /DNA_START=1330 /DNA_END=1632 /DNA_ORIENTATION=+